jgi:sporulation protein YlmC with PRC-barrel domain
MTRMLAKAIIGLPVETQSGTHLGRVVDIECDIESGVIMKYYVSSSVVVRHLLKDQSTLTIDTAQVISLTNEKMVVSDGANKHAIPAMQPAA